MRRVLVVCYIMDSPLNTPRKLLINDQVLGSIKPIQIKKVYSYNNLWYQASKRLLAEVRRIRMMLPNPKSCRLRSSTLLLFGHVPWKVGFVSSIIQLTTDY